MVTTQRRLTRGDAQALTIFFRTGQVSVAGIKAQNYELFKTFSTERGGVVDRDGNIVRQIDAERAADEEDVLWGRKGPAAERARILTIRARMHVRCPSIAWRAWCARRSACRARSSTSRGRSRVARGDGSAAAA